MKRKIPQLDAVRGIAILIVLLHNSLPKFPSLPLQPLFSYGWMGVDLFFVLSGFLITGILVDAKQSEGYFKNFYIRRCLRILPLYYSVLLLMFAIVPFLSPSASDAVFARSSPWWAYPFFLQNFLVHDSTGAAGPLGVTWSVAIEEQFYLVWAVVVRYCSYIQLRRICAAVICLSPVLRLFLAMRHVDLYSNLFCRLDGLMAGSLLAILIRSSSFIASRHIEAAWLSLFLATPLAFLSEAFQYRWLTFSISAAACAAFVYVSLFATQKWFRLALTNRWLIFIGTISYGLYLLHKLPFDVEQSIHLNQYPVLALVMGIAASCGLAILSWNIIEKPFLRLRRFFEPTLAGLGDDRRFVSVPQSTVEVT
jgi:peptidoglycan/LPS O-acetylase OafA/YrhL